ncbi:MAG: hypothetical protein KKH99_14115 [Proteobacteria bacterium]|nr:hypothetical protein [Pseudomonadota bacterium]
MSVYREKILEEIRVLPEEMLPKFYKVIHLITTEFTPELKKKGNRGSLKGIWKGSNIDEKLFAEAKRSLFPYE